MYSNIHNTANTKNSQRTNSIHSSHSGSQKSHRSSSSQASTTLPEALFFEEFSHGKQHYCHANFGDIQSSPSARDAIIYALNSKHRKNISVDRIVLDQVNQKVVSFETYSKHANRQQAEDQYVKLLVNDEGDAVNFEIREAKTHKNLCFGEFLPTEYESSSEEESLNIETLKQQWLAQQNRLHNEFSAQNLIKRDAVLTQETNPFNQKNSAHAENVTKNTTEENPVTDIYHELQTNSFCDIKLIADQAKKDTRHLRDGMHCPLLDGLILYKELETIGHQFNAPKIAYLFAYSTRLETLSKSKGHAHYGSSGGNFISFGDNFNAPNLTKLDLNHQLKFRSFGHQMHVPNLTELSMQNTLSFEHFPEDIQLPSLVTLDLKGAKNFRHFPPNFFNHTTNLRSLELLGTGIRYHQLPANIRENPNIFIDIRPANEMRAGIGNRQSTHTQSVHKSSSDSAKRVMQKMGDMPIEKAKENLHAFINALPSEKPPEDLREFMRGNLSDLVRHVLSLEQDHPSRVFFSNKNNAAKRALTHTTFQQFIDPGSQISAIDYLSACSHILENPDNRHEQVTLETAQEKIVQTLYEIARGYNLQGNEVDLVDNGDPRDLTICGAGAFNKITNVMSEILADVETVYVTPDLIRRKGQSILMEGINTLLQNGNLTDSDFTEKDDEGERFVSEKSAEKIGAPLLNSLFDYFSESVDLSDKQRNTIKQYFDYQLQSTDMTELLEKQKGKGKA